MNSEVIQHEIYALKDKWFRLIHSMPASRQTPELCAAWDESKMIRDAAECLVGIVEQLYSHDYDRNNYIYWRKMVAAGKAVRTDHTNVKPCDCIACMMPMTKGEAVCYRTWTNHYFCVLCDPAYEHCPLCDSPMVVGRCCRCHLDLS